MCEHKNLKAINDMLICKDCGNQLPMSFLTDREEKKAEDKAPDPVVQDETPTVSAEDINKAINPAEIPAANPPVESQTDKSTPEKKPRKNAKKGA